MKTAIYIEDSVVQLVLTPENDWEKRALGAFHDKAVSASFFNGQFYDCAGGWMRHRALYERAGTDHADDASLMIRADVVKPEAAS
jgi:hypothetical protein